MSQQKYSRHNNFRKQFDSSNSEEQFYNRLHTQNSDRLFDDYIQNQDVQSKIAKTLPGQYYSYGTQQAQKLVICSDPSNFDTFNQEDNNLNRRQQGSIKRKRFQLWGTSSNQKNKKQPQQPNNIIKKGKLTMAMRKPLGEIKNEQQNQNEKNRQKTKMHQQPFMKKTDKFVMEPAEYLSIISEQNKKCSQRGSVQSSTICTCQQFDKLLEITSRCVDYYNSFVIEKDEEIVIVKEAFKEISSNLSTAFNSIIDEIKNKHEEIIRFLVKKQEELCEVKQHQEENLKKSLQEIQGIHLTNFLFREGRQGSESNMIDSLTSSKQNSGIVKCCGELTGQINNYAKTLHNFYEAMEQIEKNSFKESVDETINFINNLITQEIKFIVYERIPQKSINCSFSFNNSFEDGKKLAVDNKSSSKRTQLANQLNNNFSLSPSVGTSLQLSIPNSPTIAKKSLKNEKNQSKAQQNISIGIQTQEDNLILIDLAQIKSNQEKQQFKSLGYLRKIRNYQQRKSSKKRKISTISSGTVVRY